MIEQVGPNNLILSSMNQDTINTTTQLENNNGINKSLKGSIMTTQSVLDIVGNDISKVLLLDPASSIVLNPSDGLPESGFEYLLFGGILVKEIIYVLHIYIYFFFC